VQVYCQTTPTSSTSCAHSDLVHMPGPTSASPEAAPPQLLHTCCLPPRERWRRAPSRVGRANRAAMSGKRPTCSWWCRACSAQVDSRSTLAMLGAGQRQPCALTKCVQVCQSVFVSQPLRRRVLCSMVGVATQQWKHVSSGHQQCTCSNRKCPRP
jgi:hypothetical protein